MEPEDVPSWRKLLEGPSDFDKSREIDSPKVANPIEYVYVERPVGLFLKSAGSILKDGEVCAAIPQGLQWDRAGVIDWHGGDPWTFEIRYNSGGEISYLGWIGISGPEGVLATYSRDAVFLTVTLSSIGAKVTELKSHGTRLEIWVDGSFAAEQLYVWRDSDAARGIECRAYVDGTQRGERALAVLLLILGYFSRVGQL